MCDIQIGHVSREPYNIWVQLSPTLLVGVFEQVWTSLSENRRLRKEMEEKRKFLWVKAELVRCAESSPLCVKLCEAVCSLVISLRSQNGRGAETQDERGISLTKSVSTTNRRLHQIPLIPTHWCHTRSPALNCWVSSFVEGTHHFLSADLI